MSRISAGRPGRIIWRWLPAAGWMAIIYYSSSRPGGELDGWLSRVRRALPGLESFDPMHYAAYFILALTIAYALGERGRSVGGGALNLLLCTLYGATDEWHQAYVPMRTPDPADLLHDAIGALAAIVLLALVRRAWRRRRTNIYTRDRGRSSPDRQRIR